VAEPSETWIGLAKRIAARHGFVITDQEADGVLWEHTGFPSFWPTGDAVGDCTKQLHAFFKAARRREQRPLVAERKPKDEATLRVLYHVVTTYQEWRHERICAVPNEFTDDAIRIGEEYLRDMAWWPKGAGRDG
jgi:hypothetical protein